MLAIMDTNQVNEMELQQEQMLLNAQLNQQVEPAAAQQQVNDNLLGLPEEPSSGSRVMDRQNSA